MQMASSSSSTATTTNTTTQNTAADVTILSQWPNLPHDILSTIATLVDPKLGHLRLRSVCHPWRTAVPPTSPPPLLNFPIPLPIPQPTDADETTIATTPPHLSLLQHTLYLLTSPNDPTSPFLIKLLHPTTTTTTATFSLINPLSTKPLHPTTTALNLLDYRIIPVGHSFIIVGNAPYFKKIVVSKNFTPNVPITVLGLSRNSTKLLIWNFGDENWVNVSGNAWYFDDIASFNGRFYATADKCGRLVMIDHRLTIIDLVKKLAYQSAFLTYLVGCDEGLFLINCTLEDFRRKAGFDVYKLDDKGTFWDYEYDLVDHVFFIVDFEFENFSISPKIYGGSVRNVVFYVGVRMSREYIWDVKKRKIRRVVKDEECKKLLFPPSSWFPATNEDEVRLDSTS